jgi:hypothetical protein
MRSLPHIRWLWLGLAAVIVGSAAMATNAKDREAKREAERVAATVSTVTVTTPGTTATGRSDGDRENASGSDKNRPRKDTGKNPGKVARGGAPTASPIVGSPTGPVDIPSSPLPGNESVGVLTPDPPSDGATLLPPTDPPIASPTPGDVTQPPTTTSPEPTKSGREDDHHRDGVARTTPKPTTTTVVPDSANRGWKPKKSKKPKKLKKPKKEFPHGGARAFGHEDD